MNNRFALLSLILFLFFSSISIHQIQAQCCSAGSPAGVGTYAGMLSKNTLRVTSFLRFTHSQGYYKGDSPLERPILVRQSNFLFQGVNIAYGIINQLSIDLDLGYFFLKDQTFINDYYLKGYGLSNGALSLKTKIFHSDSARVDLSGGIGLKFPFRLNPLYIDNVKLPIDLQPSTQAFGLSAQLFLKKNIIPYRLSFYFLNRYEYNFKNRDQYRFGDRLRSTMIFEATYNKHLSSMLQLKFEYAAYDFDVRVNDIFRHSGSRLFFIAPLVQYSFAERWHLSLMADIPVYKYYNGSQLSNQYSAGINITRDFNLCKKVR